MSETDTCSVRGCERPASEHNNFVVHMGAGDTANVVCLVSLCEEHAEMFHATIGRREHFDMVARDTRQAVFF